MVEFSPAHSNGSPVREGTLFRNHCIPSACAWWDLQGYLLAAEWTKCNVLGARLQSRKFPRKDFTKLAVGEPKYEKVNPQSIWKQNGKVRDQGNRKHLLAKGRAGHCWFGEEESGDKLSRPSGVYPRPAWLSLSRQSPTETVAEEFLS